MRSAAIAVALAAALMMFVAVRSTAAETSETGQELIVGETTFYRGVFCRHLGPADFLLTILEMKGEDATLIQLSTQAGCSVAGARMTVIRNVRSIRAADTGQQWAIGEVRVGLMQAFILTRLPILAGKDA